jgi:hypothetical protein
MDDPKLMLLSCQAIIIAPFTRRISRWTLRGYLALRIRDLLSVALMLGCAAAVAAPAPDAERDAELVRHLHKDLARSFVLDKELRVDPALRAAANDISAAHLVRADQLMSAWLREERGLQGAKGQSPSQAELYYPVWARLLNELTLWQLAPGDADYERATLAVLKSSPAVCDRPGDVRFSDFASRMLRIQAMPAQQRDAALASERQLLARWGTAYSAVAPWPDPLPQDAAMARLKRAQAERSALAIPPVLATRVVAEQKGYAALHPNARCALHQWWLRESLRQGATPAAALNAFRFGTLINANDRFVGTFDDESQEDQQAPDAASPSYPQLASRFGVGGVTVMRVQLDAAGKPLQVSVVERKIEVPGIRGVRPIAFENVFDPKSVRYALERQRYSKPKGSEPFVFQIVWTLPELKATPAKTPTGVTQ